MTTYVVTDKASGAEVYRYQSDAGPVEVIGFESATHTHTPLAEPATPPGAPVDPARWRIYVGSFFDRFGADKIAILADPDPVVQAIVKDASVRRYIDLIARRAELQQALDLLAAKGHAVDAAAVLDTEPTDEEVWRGD